MSLINPNYVAAPVEPSTVTKAQRMAAPMIAEILKLLFLSVPDSQEIISFDDIRASFELAKYRDKYGLLVGADLTDEIITAAAVELGYGAQ